MGTENTWWTYQQLVGEVVRVATEKISGTFFCATEDNNSASIALQEGQIVALGFNHGFKMTRGASALPLIQTIQRCKVHFRQNVIFKIDQGLPETLALLHMIANPPHATALAPEPVKSRPTLSKADEKRALSSSAKIGSTMLRLSAKVIDQLRTVLHDEVITTFGDTAPQIREQYFPEIGQLRTFEDLMRFLSAIARHIPDIQEAGAFRHRVLGRIRDV